MLSQTDLFYYLCQITKSHYKQVFNINCEPCLKKNSATNQNNKNIVFHSNKSHTDMKRHHIYLTLALATLLAGGARAQQRAISLGDAIRIAQANSYDAKLAKFGFMSSYWSYRSFRAELLPSMSLTGRLLNFDHSRVEARNSEDGRINYVDNNSLNNALTLSLDQKIASLGGTISLQSYLYRLDQFNYDLTTYQSQPLRISYTQPLKTYNELKWRKKTEPKEYEKAKKVYLEDMEDVAINVTTLYFDAIAAQSDYAQSQSKYRDLEALYKITEKRLNLGTTTKADLLQLELSMLNTQVEVNNAKTKNDDAMYDLFSYLRVTDYAGVLLTAPETVEDITPSAPEVIQKAMQNSSHAQTQDLLLLTAQQNLAKAKSEKGIQMQLNAEVGFSRTANNFTAAYRNLQDNEIVGVTVTLPIFDWGVKKGRVMMAKSNLDLALTKKEQADNDYIQKVKRSVMQFGAQAEQCRTSTKAMEISRERYDITKRRFETGAISVTELNTAIQELETAKTQYIDQLKNYWTYYYTLRRYTLYDWAAHRDLTADYDDIVKP